MIKGYRLKLLSIDLSSKSVKPVELSPSLVKSEIGGKGIASHFIAQLVDPKIDPLSPENAIVWSTGPLNGTPFPGASKTCMAFKSPLTGGWGESYCGGTFSTSIKLAGFDAIIVKGKSREPCFIRIDNGEVRIENASHLWGLDCYETQRELRKDLGDDYSIISIGPAGENLVRFASVDHDFGREFGRCGSGAVMGSKLLKAVAVRGDKDVVVHDPNALWALSEEIARTAQERLAKLAKYGTPPMILKTNAFGVLPTRYWEDGFFEFAEKLFEKLVERMAGTLACFGCPLACRKLYLRIGGGYLDGPDYETLFALGPLCGISDADVVIEANDLCDRLGMDTISAGNVVAFAMACCERGLIDADFRFGDGEFLLRLLRLIARREGIGDVLAEGVRRASQKIKGAEPIAVHCKGLEPPGYDPRGLKGVALAYAVSPRGACHLRHVAYRSNMAGRHPFEDEAIDRLSFRGQAKLVWDSEVFYTFADSLVICRFLSLPVNGPVLWEEALKAFKACTGLELDKSRAIELCAGICRRIDRFNEACGLPAYDLSPRFHEPLKRGASKGQSVLKGEFEEALREYLRLKSGF